MNSAVSNDLFWVAVVAIIVCTIIGILAIASMVVERHEDKYHK